MRNKKIGTSYKFFDNKLNHQIKINNKGCRLLFERNSHRVFMQRNFVFSGFQIILEDLCFFFMELYRTFVKNGRVESERRELIQLLLFIKIFYYSFAKKIFYADEYSLKKMLKNVLLLKYCQKLSKKIVSVIIYSYIYICYLLIKWFGCKMSKMDVKSLRNILLVNLKTYMYISLFFSFSLLRLIQQKISYVLQKKKKFISSPIFKSQIFELNI